MAMGLRRLDRRRRLYIVPFQWEWVLEEVGLTRSQTERAAWTITSDGLKAQGAAAINIALDVILGTSPLFYRLYNLPLNRSAQDGIYRWVARYRSTFPGATPAVEQVPSWRPQRLAD